MMDKNAKIYVAGHRGMVGSAIVRELQRQGYTNIVTRTHAELDLCRQDAVEAFFAEEKPEYVFLAAAKVGGIVANQNALAVLSTARKRVNSLSKVISMVPVAPWRFLATISSVWFSSMSSCLSSSTSLR